MGEVVSMDLYRKWIPVLAYCDNCEFTRVMQVTESQYRLLKRGGMMICPECKCLTMYYCDKAKS